MLRHLVLPDFFSRIGEVSWRNVFTTVTLAAAARQTDLPDDFWKMRAVYLPQSPGQTAQVIDGSWCFPPDWNLRYIGENTPRILACEAGSTPGKPREYWIAPRIAVPDVSTDISPRAIRFGCVADQAYTAYIAYERGPVFADDSTQVDMNNFVPELLQTGLVKGLRREILELRYNADDPRYAAAAAAFERWLETTDVRGSQLAPKTHGKYV